MREVIKESYLSIALVVVGASLSILALVWAKPAADAVIRDNFSGLSEGATIEEAWVLLIGSLFFFAFFAYFACLAAQRIANRFSLS